MSGNSAYAEFLSGVNEYYRLYGTGLKKRGNAYLKEYIKKFRARPKEERDAILNEFCRFVCDGEEGKKLLERGNGELPFELRSVVSEYLVEKCNRNEMPHMRWYYELFNSSRLAFEDGALDPADILKRAYAHRGCDGKTVEFYFRYWLNILDWGAHHFPEACIIDKEEYEFAFENIEKISNAHAVPEELSLEAEYFKKLYKAWERYLAEDKKRPFCDYCAENGVTFTETATIYYE